MDCDGLQEVNFCIDNYYCKFCCISVSESELKDEKCDWMVNDLMHLSGQYNRGSQRQFNATPRILLVTRQDSRMDKLENAYK